MMFIFTFLSWGTAFLLSGLLRASLLKGPTTPFLLELPPYRLPTLQGLFIHTWERAWLYMRKAGTIILSISILLWGLMNFPGLPEARKETFETKRQAIGAEAPEDLRSSLLAGTLDQENLPEEVAELKERIHSVDYAEAQAALE
jgi:ferrous iron transport protein B